MIIDAHGHLGDILYPGGGDLIWQKGVVKATINDPQDTNEKLLMRKFGLGKFLYGLLKRRATLGQRARNATANPGKLLPLSGSVRCGCRGLPSYRAPCDVR